jgi:hypothetical protein
MQRTARNLTHLLRSQAFVAALAGSIALHWTATLTSAQQVYIDPTKGALQVDRSRDPYAPGYAKAQKRSGTIGPGLYPPGSRAAQALPKRPPSARRDCRRWEPTSRRERRRYERQCLRRR